MNYEEALKILTTNEYDFGCGDCTWGAGQPKECDNQSCEYKQATEIAIETLEKQIPMKPQIDKQALGRNFIVYECPICKHQLDSKTQQNYCYNCGQALNWE